jgi:hypothetical protein
MWDTILDCLLDEAGVEQSNYFDSWTGKACSAPNNSTWAGITCAGGHVTEINFFPAGFSGGSLQQTNETKQQQHIYGLHNPVLECCPHRTHHQWQIGWVSCRHITPKLVQPDKFAEPYTIQTTAHWYVGSGCPI